ncbi:MAG: D-Ala-D-Ala carboxypeptidase family metallohydrolase [Hyphomicrobiales bacterium]
MCFATITTGCAVREEAGFGAAAPEPIKPTIEASSFPNPTGITADVSQEVLAARSAGIPYPVPNATFLANEKSTYLKIKTTLDAKAVENQQLAATKGGASASKATASASETAVVENSAAHAAAQNLALSQPSAKTTKLNQNSKAASLPGVKLKTGLEGTLEEKAPKTVASVAPTKAILPTLTSYASYSLANDRVNTKCFPGRLRKILGQVHNRFGKKPEVSSGYRNAAYNRRIGGSRGSYHTKCQAADIKVRGVDKYVLAKYVRSLPDRGGVGVYGCKGVVHVDVGPRRNWHHPCRKRRRS